MYNPKNPKDAAKIHGDRPLIAVGGAILTRHDVEPPPGCRPATTIPQPDANAQVDGLTAPARQRMAERRRRGA